MPDLRAQVEDSASHNSGGDVVLSVITLNYRNAELTARCVQAVIHAVKKLNVPIEIIVVNNSAHFDSAVLQAMLPASVRHIDNVENVGFAQANNQGIQLSIGKYILLVNNDAFVDSTCLQAGLRYLDNDKRVGIWTPRLVNENGSIQQSCGEFPSLVSLIREYWFRQFPAGYNDFENWYEPKEVGTVVGAFMLIPRTVICRTGLLDERFFFNMEDVDLCMRVHKAGYRVIYDPNCQIVHLARQSQLKLPWYKDPHLHRSRIQYYQKYFDPFTALVAAIVIRSGLLLRAVKAKLTDNRVSRQQRKIHGKAHC